MRVSNLIAWINSSPVHARPRPLEGAYSKGCESYLLTELKVLKPYIYFHSFSPWDHRCSLEA